MPREWKNHKWIDRKRGPGGKWIYDYGNGYPGERHQYIGASEDKYSSDTAGRALKTISDVVAPISPKEIYADNLVGRVMRLSDDICNLGASFTRDLRNIRLPF